MSVVSQNLTVIRVNSSPWRHFVHQSTTSKSFNYCKISWSLWCLEDHIWQSLHPAFQNNKYDRLPSKQNFHCLFSYCLGFDWCQNKFLAKVVVNPAKKPWCWTAMSAQSLGSLGKCLQRKRSLVHRAFSFCELTVGTWDIFEGFLVLGSFSRDRWMD